MTDTTPTHVEDISDQPLDPEAVLSDDQLVAGGLTPVKGWMRTRSSKNAQRIKKSRERAEAGDGERAPRKQLNIAAPTDDGARAVLKAVAAEMIDGAMTPSDLDAALRDREAVKVGKKAQRVFARGGVRAALLRRLLR